MKRSVLTLVSAAAIAFSFSQNVGINPTGISPDASAGLDVDFTSKGILIPRVALVQTSSPSPVTSPVASLVLYNTATVNDVTPGYYYWNGAQWVRFVTGPNTAWMTAGNAASGSDFLGTTSNFPLVIKTNNTEHLRVQANGTLKITGTSITSPGIWMDGTVTAAATTAYGILSRGILTAAASGDGFFPFSTNLGTVNTGTFTGLTYYGGHFDAASCTKTGTGTIDNAYGIYVTAPSMATNNYGGAFLGGGSQLKLLLSSGSSTALTTIDFGLASPTDPEGSLSVAASAGQFSEFAVAQDVVLRARKNNLILCTRNVSSPSAGDILFGTGMPCTEKMRIMNGGNVGIGTTTPDAELEVVSLATSNPRGFLVTGYNSTASAETQVRIRKANGSESTPASTPANDQIGGIVFDGYTGSAFGAGARIIGKSTEAWSATAKGTCLILQTCENTTTGVTERMRIDHNGFIGMGTNSPASNLHVFQPSSSSPVGEMSLDVNSFNNVPNKQASYYLRCRDMGAGPATDFYVRGDGYMGIRTGSPTSMVDIEGNGSSGYDQLRLRKSVTPTGTADANGNTGDFAWDDNYVYIKTSAGWKRAALSVF